jgi:hypothetical protein
MPKIQVKLTTYCQKCNAGGNKLGTHNHTLQPGDCAFINAPYGTQITVSWVENGTTKSKTLTVRDIPGNAGIVDIWCPNGCPGACNGPKSWMIPNASAYW